MCNVFVLCSCLPAACLPLRLSVAPSLQPSVRPSECLSVCLCASPLRELSLCPFLVINFWTALTCCGCESQPSSSPSPNTNPNPKPRTQLNHGFSVVVVAGYRFNNHRRQDSAGVNSFNLGTLLQLVEGSSWLSFFLLFFFRLGRIQLSFNRVSSLRVQCTRQTGLKIKCNSLFTHCPTSLNLYDQQGNSKGSA